jgi:hypothetical protein
LKTSGSIRLFVERARGTRDGLWGFFFFFFQALVAALATHSLTSSRSFPIPILRETPKRDDYAELDVRRPAGGSGARLELVSV